VGWWPGPEGEKPVTMRGKKKTGKHERFPRKGKKGRGPLNKPCEVLPGEPKKLGGGSRFGVIKTRAVHNVNRRSHKRVGLSGTVRSMVWCASGERNKKNI